MPTKVTDEMKAQMRALILSGRKPRAIAIELRISAQLLYYYRRKWGLVKLRRR